MRFLFGSEPIHRCIGYYSGCIHTSLIRCRKYFAVNLWLYFFRVHLTYACMVSDSLLYIGCSVINSFTGKIQFSWEKCVGWCMQAEVWVTMILLLKWQTSDLQFNDTLRAKHLWWKKNPWKKYQHQNQRAHRIIS